MAVGSHDNVGSRVGARSQDGIGIRHGRAPTACRLTE